MFLTDAERKVMDLVWKNGDQTAKALAADLAVTANWRKTTSYTMITRCVDKGFLRREEPNFTCTAAVSKEEVAVWETNELMENHFHGSASLLMASLVEQKKLSLEDVEKLYNQLREA